MFNKNNKNFADNIRKLRNSKSQEKFASEINDRLRTVGIKTNYDNKTISKWENGDCLPDTSIIVGLSRVYNISLDLLMKDTIDSFKIDDSNNVELFSLDIIEKVKNNNMKKLISNWGEYKYGIFSYFIKNIDNFYTDDIHKEESEIHFSAPIGCILEENDDYQLYLINNGNGEIQNIQVKSFSNEIITNLPDKLFTIEFNDNRIISNVYVDDKIFNYDDEKLYKSLKNYLANNQELINKIENTEDINSICSDLMFNEINFLEFDLNFLTFDEAKVLQCGKYDNKNILLIIAEGWLNLNQKQILKILVEEFKEQLKREFAENNKWAQITYFTNIAKKLNDDEKEFIINELQPYNQVKNSIEYNENIKIYAPRKEVVNSKKNNIYGNKRTFKDDFIISGEKPKAFVFYGEYYRVNNQNDMMIQLFELLYKLDNSILDKLADEKFILDGCRTIFISRDEDDFYRAHKEILHTGIYVLTNLNIQQKLDFVRYIISEYEFDDNDFYYVV